MDSQMREAMPLFSPSYQPQYLIKERKLLSDIESNHFTEESNLNAQDLLIEDQGNYNAWYLKKKYLLAQEKKEEIILDEMQFVDECIAQKPKGFQVWEQKRFLIEQGSDWKSQLPKVETVLVEKDRKNYHAWSFRVWLTNYAKIHQKQLMFAEKMIQKDPFNNSAWSHLYFALEVLAKESQSEEARKKLLDNYVNYALQSLKDHKYNRASWNFLRGLFPSIRLRDFTSQNTLKKNLIPSYDLYPEILEFCEAEWKQINQNKTEVKAEGAEMVQREILATLVHIYSQKEQNLEYAKNICGELKGKEQMREHYWEWIQVNL